MNKWEKINDNYLRYNLKIFPVIKNGKTPIINEWNKSCSSDYLQVLYWIENARDCNWGLPCKENNLFVLDLDRHDVEKDGVENFKKLCDDLKIELPSTLIQETPSLGQHYIFKGDEELRQVNGVANAFKDYPGIDIRNSNYIVVTPSEINGKHYHFINNIKPQPMNEKLKQYILDTVGTKTEHKKTPYEKPKEVFKGNRDTSLFEYINYLYFKTPLDEDEITLLAKDFNNNFDEPLSEKDVKYKLKKCFEKSRGEFLVVRIPEEEL